MGLAMLGTQAGALEMVGILAGALEMLGILAGAVEMLGILPEILALILDSLFHCLPDVFWNWSSRA